MKFFRVYWKYCWSKVSVISLFSFQQINENILTFQVHIFCQVVGQSNQIVSWWAGMMLPLVVWSHSHQLQIIKLKYLHHQMLDSVRAVSVWRVSQLNPGISCKQKLYSEKFKSWNEIVIVLDVKAFCHPTFLTRAASLSHSLKSYYPPLNSASTGKEEHSTLLMNTNEHFNIPNYVLNHPREYQFLTNSMAWPGY